MNSNKISPYSNNGVFTAMYYPLLNNWSGLGNIHGIEIEKNLNFSSFLKELIKHSIKESELWVEDNLNVYLEDYIKNRIIKKNEFNIRSKETLELINLKNKINYITNCQNDFNIINYETKIKKNILSNYVGFEKIKPKKIDVINSGNLKENILKMKSTQRIRLSKFKGLKYKQKGMLHFVDAIEPSIVYYNKTQNIDYIESLIKGVVSYTFRVNTMKNTKLILQKLKNIDENDLKLNDPDFDFKNILQFEKEVKNKKINPVNIDKIVKNKKD